MQISESTQKHSYSKKLVFLVISFSIMFLSIISISVYVGLNLTKPEREVINENPNKYGLDYEDITFKSSYDNTLLKGWWIPSNKSADTYKHNETIIFSHGYGDSRILKNISVLNLAKRLVKEGYNVLVFDFRASGESEGEISSIGQFEKYDLLSAIKFAKEEKKSKDIHLIGWSMGSVATILAGVESDDVKTIIADSPFANLRDYLKVNLPVWSHLPNFPFTNIVLATLPTIVGKDINIDSVSPIHAVANLKDKHMLLIHSKDDTKIPFSNSTRIYDAVSDKSLVDVWYTKKADHIRSYLVDKNSYEKKILSFLKNK